MLAIGLLAGRQIWGASAQSTPTFRRLTFRRGPIQSARFAPDSSTILYSASFDGAPKAELFSTRLENLESQRLALTDRWVAAISRSGEMLLLHPFNFKSGYVITGTLSQSPLSGSSERELLEDVAFADWSPDGATMAAVRAPQSRFRLEFPAGKVLYETAGWVSYARVSPNGDAVAFFDHPTFGDDRGSVAIMDRAGKKTILSGFFASVQGLAWSASGKEIWFTASPSGSARGLYAVTQTKKVRTVLPAPGTLTLQDISRDGRVLLSETNVRIGFLGLFPGETRERDLSGYEWSWGPRLSPDGKTIVFTEQGEAGGPGYSVYQRKPDGSPPVRLGEGVGLAVSPDGKWVLTVRIQTPPATLVLLPTGAGQPKAFPKDSIDRSTSFGRFLPDGKSIVYNGSEPGKPTRVFVQDLDGGAARPVTPEGVSASLLSPDGRLLLTRAEGQGFALSPLAGGPSTPVSGLEPGDWPAGWTADGGAIFVSSQRVVPARLLRVDLTTGRRDLWKEFTPGDATGITGMRATSVSADGNSILFTYAHRLDELYVAEGLK